MRKWPIQLGVALLVVGLGLLISEMVFAISGRRIPYMPFFPALIAASLLGGWRAGALATLFSIVTAALLIRTTSPSWYQNTQDLVTMVLFILCCAFIVAAGEWMVRARVGEQAALERGRRADERLHQFLESISDAFVSLDPGLNFTYANRAACTLLSKRVEDFVGNNLWKAFPEVANTPFDTALRQAIAQQQPVHLVEYLPAHKRWYQVSLYPGDEGISVFFQDATQRKEAEEEKSRLLANERAAREEAEHASQMKDNFLATLSHELRTPLNAILGWAQLLRQDSSDPADLDQGLETIERNARSQTQLIEDLLDMSRVIAGKLRLDVQRVDLRDVIEAAIQTVGPSAEARQIRIEKILDPRAGMISGDPARLQQVVWNLLSNAIKFTPRGGKVQVILGRVNSHIELAIADTGEGIEPQFLPHVFDRFRQADSSTTRRHGGLGLGLAIVKNLVELHGGTIQVASEGKGKGATFTIALPLSAISRAEPEKERQHPRNGAASAFTPDPDRLTGLKVLVVDDEADSRLLIQRLIRESGATVAIAGSAAEGLDQLAGFHPDVLISDIGMPEVDGYAFMGQVRALSESQCGKIPAIALTAFARSEDRTRALLAGFQVHVAKPVEPAELIATVASVSGRTGAGRMGA